MAARAIVFFACLALAQAKLAELSCGQVRALVDGHNARRGRVARGQLPGQPPAARMTRLVWDEELAAKAGAWAARNKFSHNPDKSVKSGRFTAGENLYWFASSARDAHFQPERALRAWFAEHKDFTFAPLRPAHFSSGPMIGHYTQLVWANSTHLGCGVSQYRADDMNNFLLVCNYGPGGNYIGETPYERAAGAGANSLACAGAACRRPYGKRCQHKQRKTTHKPKA